MVTPTPGADLGYRAHRQDPKFAWLLTLDAVNQNKWPAEVYSHASSSVTLYLSTQRTAEDDENVVSFAGIWS